MKDKSKQGFIDEDIKNLINLINKNPNYKTTSSCSGRIVLLKIPKIGKKYKAKWLYKTHKKANPKEIIKILKKEKHLHFLQEPAILHINCKNLESANKLLLLAHQSGFKNSGIISLKKNTLGLRSTEKIEAPLDIEKINTPYIKFLVEEANKKLKRTKEKINKLENNLKERW